MNKKDITDELNTISADLILKQDDPFTAGTISRGVTEIETLRERARELERQVCDQCSPDDYGWNYNAVEGRIPCVCITESGAYQELEATLARVKGLQRYSIENNGKGFGSHREIWDKDGTYVRAAELQAELEKDDE